MKKLFLIIMFLSLSGCLGMPKLVKPVESFELNNYLGTWYEIARLDHSFEEGLSQVTAEYKLGNDGGVSVTNKGFLSETGEWKEALGKAYFVNSETEGYLKVSFFGPFYGSYVVFELEREHYEYAFVSGPSNEYLWLLSRTPSVSPKIIEKFEKMSSDRGFDIDKIIYVQHK
jgi:apolipoprotein D and lipocalin family protein